MNRREIFGLLGGGLFAALMSSCGSGPSGKYRFRMTVEVQTPQGLRVGSAVYEVRSYYEFGLDPSGRVRRAETKGEAVAVDLPGGRTLFALLKPATSGDDSLAQMSMAALDPNYRNDWVESAMRIAAGSGIRSPGTVSTSDYPLLVTFTDIRDPKSVVRVDPANVAATLGSNMALRRITVAVTDEPVTTGIEKRLGWLDRLNQYETVPGNPFTNNLPREIGSLRAK